MSVGALQTLRYEVAERVATLTLDLPARRNSLGEDNIPEIVTALERFGADDAARALIVTGAGAAFCAGGDFRMMEDWQRRDAEEGRGGFDPIAQRERYRRGIQRIPLAFARIDKPVIAAVNGAAMGAGCDLAMMADLRIASERATFGEVFCKVGLAPGDGGAWYLTRLVGVEKACELLFTGDVIDAEEALRIGLVGRVVAHGELMGEARALAERIAAGPLDALRMAKMAVYQSPHQTLEQSLEMMALMQSMLHGTADHREGLAAFREKRAPKFGQR